MEELGKCGPLIIPGKFGRSYYTNLPQGLNEKGIGKQVFGWKASERRNISRSHIVTIIGVVKYNTPTNEGGYVYIMDPNDLSDPLNTIADKIYKISYKNLKENIDRFPLMGVCHLPFRIPYLGPTKLYSIPFDQLTWYTLL